MSLTFLLLPFLSSPIVSFSLQFSFLTSSLILVLSPFIPLYLSFFPFFNLSSLHLHWHARYSFFVLSSLLLLPSFCLIVFLPPSLLSFLHLSSRPQPSSLSFLTFSSDLPFLLSPPFPILSFLPYYLHLILLHPVSLSFPLLSPLPSPHYLCPHLAFSLFLPLFLPRNLPLFFASLSVFLIWTYIISSTSLVYSSSFALFFVQCFDNELICISSFLSLHLQDIFPFFFCAEVVSLVGVLLRECVCLVISVLGVVVCNFIATFSLWFPLFSFPLFFLALPVAGV